MFLLVFDYMFSSFVPDHFVNLDRRKPRQHIAKHILSLINSVRLSKNLLIISLRRILPINWIFREISGVVAYIEAKAIHVGVQLETQCSERNASKYFIGL